MQTNYPGYKIQSVATYGGSAASWNFRLVPPPGKGKRVQVYVDQYRGSILGEDNFDGKFMQVVYDLHADLLFGKNGRIVNGVCALLFVLLCLTGLIIWFPGSRKWRNGFAWKKQSNWRGKNYNLHKLTGFYSAVLLILIAITGAYFPFKKEYEQITAFVTGTPHTLESPKITSPEPIKRLANLDTIYKNALKCMPAGEITFIRFPQKPEDNFSVRKMLPGDWGRIGDNYVFLDRYTGTLIREDYFDRLPIGVKTTRAMFPLHFGTFWRDFSRILWLVLGLAVPLLFFTGFLMWFNKLKKRKPGQTKNRNIKKKPQRLKLKQVKTDA